PSLFQNFLIAMKICALNSIYGAWGEAKYEVLCGRYTLSLDEICMASYDVRSVVWENFRG
ncbi:MAG: hypothetical protein R3Y11_02825, partial [Pseudomonadota bacterium]